MSDIPAVIWNIRAVAVFAPLVCTTQLATQEEDEPDQERAGHHQWRRERGKVSEHTCPFLLSVARCNPSLTFSLITGRGLASAVPLAAFTAILTAAERYPRGCAPTIRTGRTPLARGRQYQAAYRARQAGGAGSRRRGPRSVTKANAGTGGALSTARAGAPRRRFSRKRGFTRPRHGRIGRRVPRGSAYSLTLFARLQQRL